MSNTLRAEVRTWDLQTFGRHLSVQQAVHESNIKNGGLGGGGEGFVIKSF
jgi:hypothetical protein